MPRGDAARSSHREEMFCLMERDLQSEGEDGPHIAGFSSGNPIKATYGIAALNPASPRSGRGGVEGYIREGFDARLGGK